MWPKASWKVRAGFLLLVLGLGAAIAIVHLRRAPAPVGAVNLPEVTQDFGHQKVVYHITENGDDRAGRMLGWLGSMQNHFNALKPGALELAVVMNGDGINLLVKARSDPGLAARIDWLKQRGARFLVCRNTLLARNLDPASDLYDVKTADVVAAGVAEIALLEAQGYGYLRP